MYEFKIPPFLQVRFKRIKELLSSSSRVQSCKLLRTLALILQSFKQDLFLRANGPWFPFWIVGVHSATIVQSPQSVVEELGRQISLECSLEGTSNPYIYWYRQLPGGQIYMLAYSVSTGQVDNSGPSHFSTSRTKDKEFLLSINGLLANDTGVYYWVWSHTLKQVCAAPLLPIHWPVCPSLVVQ
uniref:Ig-like domain-containing protein n=1 Tax=Terrapene triunguis TaxID=2587831 RepID=A0A674J5G5_9SAUR